MPYIQNADASNYYDLSGIAYIAPGAVIWVTQSLYDNSAVIAAALVAGEIIDFTGKPQPSDRIGDMITAIGSNGDLRLAKDTYRVTQNKTIPEEVRLVFEQSAIISVDGIAISAITKANPGEVTTSSAHNFSNGDKVRFKDVGGMVELNYSTNGGVEYTVTIVNSTKFTIGVNTSSYTTYTSGGYAQHILTINGTIDAGLYQIFAGNGSISLPGFMKEVLPEWWGAVGNGVADDTTAIQKASDSISTSGGLIFLSEGTYIISPGPLYTVGAAKGASGIRLYSNMQLKGSGWGTILKWKDNAIATNDEINLIANSNNTWEGNHSGNSNIIVSDLMIDGNKGNQATGIVNGIHFDYVAFGVIQNVFLKNVKDWGIVFDQDDGISQPSTNCTAIANVIEACGQISIYPDASTKLLIKDNFIIDSGLGISLHNGCVESIVEGNYIKGLGTSTGINIDNGSDRTHIRDNTIINAESAIIANGASTPLYHLAISNNIINTPQGEGILLANTHESIITGNVIRRAKNRGISISTSDNNNVRGNTIIASSYGGGSYAQISLSGADQNLVAGNHCASEVGAPNQPMYGILLTSDCVSNIVQSNQLTAAGTSGAISDSGVLTIILDMPFPTDVKDKELADNLSGITLTSGMVVIYGGGTYSTCTTTTTKGNPKVYGVVRNASIAPGNYASIQTKGKVTTLKVNGTDPISIGDLLATYTTAGIACKAVAGNTAFAIAKEDYAVADSNGIIDALLIPPRQA